MKWREQQKLRMHTLVKTCPFTGGRYINKEKGWDFSIEEVWDRIGKPGFVQLTIDCKGFLTTRTKQARSEDKFIIKQLNSELAVERNQTVCPRCGFKGAK